MVIAGVDEAGDAVLEQFRRGERRRKAHVIAVERRFVRIHAVEQERLRVRLVRQPARKLERGMQVAVDEARRRHRIGGIDRPRGGIGLRYRGGLVDGDNLSAFHRDRRIAHDAAAGIDGNEPVDIGDDQINGLHVIPAYFFSPT